MELSRTRYMVACNNRHNELCNYCSLYVFCLLFFSKNCILEYGRAEHRRAQVTVNHPFRLWRFDSFSAHQENKMAEPRELMMGYCGVCGKWTVHSRPQHKKRDKYTCTICVKFLKENVKAVNIAPRFKGA